MNNKIKKILLIDDNQEVSEIIAEGLMAEGYNVSRVDDGAEALKILENENWYCIVCDLQMPHISGIMFLKIIRDQGLKFPVIFITGFHSTIETEEAFRLGAQAFISKPFEIDELLKKLIEIESFNSIVNQTKVELKVEELYNEIYINELTIRKKIIYPIYLKLSSTNFVKIAQTGEDLDQSKIDSMTNLGVGCFYLEAPDYYNYIKHNLQAARNLLQFHDIKDSNKRVLFINICKNILEYEFQHDKNFETLSVSFLSIHNSLKRIAEDEELFAALKSLYEFSPTKTEHSILVALIASGLAIQAEEFNYKTVLEVSLAGIFHDLGFIQLPKNLSGKPKEKMTFDELSLYKTHPQLGCLMIESMKSQFESMAKAILHHHEHSDGSGFPSGIGGAQVHPIGRLISIADYLAHTWSDN